ncbi:MULTISPECIES: TetR family transcriptional regulator [Gordonia]|uniref:TetR family transcriptional regulator n=1 Tax=Gordonia TaxID=2053 RepID=UPI00117F2158|nr:MULTISPECIES: TetR family transcriptional regulator [Gordonia]MDH3044896.1 TetR family transcriptional regulator [Gordonia alkanivorans]TSD97103.1 TetR/AcrR family transcriptional regulator [Gordonia rubripertincta]
MPRIAEARDAAEPSSHEQRARHVRMLEAAAELATEKELARVQMAEVAKRAGVAIGTLYRYFPSKTHLFVAVMVEQVDQIGESLRRRPTAAGGGRDAIYEVLVRATRALLRRPALSTAMIQSSSTANAALVPDAAKVDRVFQEILMSAGGIDDPTEDDVTAIRLLMQLWLGVIQSCLNGRISIPDAEADIRTACDLLLARMSIAD